MTTYRFMDGVSGRPGVASSGTQPPASPTPFSGNYIAGLIFQATSTVWLQGYYWWVPPGGDTGSVKCALWQQGGPSGASQGTVVPGSTVTSGTLTAGQWNFIALSSPMLLAWPSSYIAALGYATTIGFPDTQHQFGAGNPYVSGITNGPITAQPTNSNGPQQPFSTASADPAAVMPFTNDADDLLWLDVQVTDTPPAGASYRLWPSLPYAAGDGTNGGVSVNTNGYTMSVQFTLSQACALNKIWFYSATTAFSASAATDLPTRVTLWDTNTQLPVSGGDISGVSWKKPDGTAASAGAGWIYADFSGTGVALAASNAYKASVWYTGGSTWRTVVDSYWTTGATGVNGITSGPLTAPNSAGATPGQDSWHGPNLAWHYPDTFSNPENDWVDVEVTPLPPPPGMPPLARGIASRKRRHGRQQAWPQTATASAVTITGTAALAGAGAVTAVAAQIAGATVAGAGTVTAAVTQAAGATVAGAGVVTDVATQIAGTTLTGAGAVTASVSGTSSGTATIAGAGAVTAVVTQGAVAAPAAAGTVTASVVQAATASLAGAGTVSAKATQGAGASLAGAGAVTANGSALAAGATATIAGAGAVTANATLIAGAAPAGTSALTVLAAQRATAALTAAGVLTATGMAAAAVQNAVSHPAVTGQTAGSTVTEKTAVTAAVTQTTASAPAVSGG